MSAVTLQLRPETESKLRLAAGRVGKSLEKFIEQLAADIDVAAAQPPKFLSEPRPTPEEFDRLILALAAGPALPVLPSEFSRADLYDDHD